MKSEWKTCTIGDLCDSVSVTYRGVDDRVVLVNTSDVLDGKVLNHSDEPNKNLKGQFKKTFKKDDILYSEIRPANRRFAYIDFEETERYIASTKLMVIRFRENVVEPRFLYFLLTSNSVISELQRLAETRSGTFPQITFPAEVATLPAVLPPLPIQRKIASILTALDDKIETNNAICRNLEELLLAVYRNVKYVNECVVKELHDLAEFSKNKKQISELNCQSYFSTENMLPGKAGAVAAESLPTMPKATACNPGDILVSNIRPYFKKIVYCSTNCGCSSDVLCFHPKEDIYSTWLFCSLYEDDFFDYVAAGSKGTKMPRGDKAHIMRYGIDVPPRKKLEEFKSMGNLALTQINNLRSENKHLSQLRDSILPKLMNGELDVDNVKLK